MRFLILILKNVRRNIVRSSLTALGTMMMVFVVILVKSILSFLDAATVEKSANLKAIVTERWQIPSQMPYTYAESLSHAGASKPGDIEPLDSMTWQFYGGSLDSDPKKRDWKNSLFAFALEPKKLTTMMDDLDNLREPIKSEFAAVVKKLEDNRQGIIVGKARLAQINKKVGERIMLYGINYRDIDLEVEIVGLFPDGRYDNSAAINRDYLMSSLDAYQQKNRKPHPLMQKSLNLVWLRVADTAMFAKIDEQIEKSPLYSNPEVKCETASSGVSTFLEAYRDLIWGMKWLLQPAILATLTLVIANSISISVRERRTEMAVMKVLGFRPWQILVLVLGEALLIGITSGMVSSGLTYYVINDVLGGIKFPIAFFGAFLIPKEALWWGPFLGAMTAFAGSFAPAWSAQKVKVAEVFSRVG